MLYYCKEVYYSKKSQNTAGVKARDDAEKILKEKGFVEILVEGPSEDCRKISVINHISRAHAWTKALKVCKEGDVLFLQFPLRLHTIYASRVFKQVKEKGVKIILLVHDLDLLRVARSKSVKATTKYRIQREELSMLQIADYVILHNSKMLETIESIGCCSGKLIDLNIFDYLIPDANVKKQEKTLDKTKPIIIAGTLRKHKANYAYNLPDDIEFNLYGVDYTGDTKSSVHYYGAFPPNQLPYVMDGSFGLVWDGPTINGCSGAYGEYLKINNPHKTSLYLASGFPVIIWKDAALADFIESQKLGFVVESIHEIKGVINNISEDEYNQMVENTKIIGKYLRDGYYLKTAIDQCVL